MLDVWSHDVELLLFVTIINVLWMTQFKCFCVSLNIYT